MRSSCFTLLFFTLALSQLESNEPVYKFEGILGSASEIIENQNALAPGFLPYNPTVIEIGSYEGAGTLQLAHAFPYGRIFSFEPNPRAFAVLQQRVKTHNNVFPVNLAISHTTGDATLYLYHGENKDHPELEHLSSLLPLADKNVSSFESSSMTVPCMTLDAWCLSHHIDHVDFLRVDAGGLELRILESSPKALQQAIVIVVKTYLRQFRANGALYLNLKQFLEKNDFEMLAHWYCEGSHGEATFVRKAYYNSIFR
jgi:FkbM family methyltransferase